jgi:hypothetical protein
VYYSAPVYRAPAYAYGAPVVFVGGRYYYRYGYGHRHW